METDEEPCEKTFHRQPAGSFESKPRTCTASFCAKCDRTPSVRLRDSEVRSISVSTLSKSPRSRLQSVEYTNITLLTKDFKAFYGPVQLSLSRASQSKSFRQVLDRCAELHQCAIAIDEI